MTIRERVVYPTTRTAIGIGLLASILIVAVYIALLGCPVGAVEVEGDLFTNGRCFVVVDGVVHSETPGL